MAEYAKVRGQSLSQHGRPGNHYPHDLIFVFDPGFEKFCDQYAEQLLKTNNDSRLIGHFSDNELPFPSDALKRFLKLDAKDFGYQAAKKWLTKERGYTESEKPISQEEQDRFLEYMAGRYFEITSTAIRKYDKNHLVLGSRFHELTEFNSPALFRAAGRYVDVISVNYYRVLTPDLEQMKNWEKWAGRPFIISEWYAKAMDSGLPNTTGGGWLVKTQTDRGDFYQNFTLALIESKNCIGWHWYKYMDNDPNKVGQLELSNLDSNKGIVSINFDEYQPLVEKMQELNLRIYSLADFFDQKN